MAGAPCFDWPIIMIRPHALRLIVSRLFKVPVLFLGAGLEKSKITELLHVKKVFAGSHTEHHWGCRNKCTNFKVWNCKYALQQQRQQFKFSSSSVAVFLRHECRHDLLQRLCLLLLACLLAVRGSRGWMSKSEPV